MDINCDLGEGCGNDAELMKYITSANIACGYHAGDVDTMRRTVELAIEHKVWIGAHPSYPDRQNFGRTPMNMELDDVAAIVTDQISLMSDICTEFGTRLHHVKPHGALYNQSAKDRELAATIARTVANFDRDLFLYGLSGSHSIVEAYRAGIEPFSEVFADRTYQPDGTLTPRAEPNSLIQNVDSVILHVMEINDHGTVTATNGATVSIWADTICIHGDGEHAVEFARAVYDALINDIIPWRNGP